MNATGYFNRLQEDGKVYIRDENTIDNLSKNLDKKGIPCFAMVVNKFATMFELDLPEE